jgi:hypothetical protein
MKRLIISIFLLILIVSSSSGQNVNVSSAFDSSRIYIGDQIKFTLTVDQPSNLHLTLPVFKDTICKNIEILSGPFTDSSSVQKGRLKIIQKYLITSFDSGRYKVKSVFAEVKSESGIKRYYSNSSLLDVMRVKIAPADTTSKIFDIIKPYKAPVTLGDILPWLLIIALIGALAWAAMRFFRKFKRTKEGVETLISADPAHVIAFRELENLREQQLWQKGEIKKYYTKLTEILRQYLENRFSVFSLELTTAETLDALVKTGFKKDGSYNNLKSVLTGADLVKFAKHVPVPTENESHFQNSWEFVVATREEAAVVTAEEQTKNVQEAIL